MRPGPGSGLSRDGPDTAGELRSSRQLRKPRDPHRPSGPPPRPAPTAAGAAGTGSEAPDRAAPAPNPAPTPEAVDEPETATAKQAERVGVPKAAAPACESTGSPQARYGEETKRLSRGFLDGAVSRTTYLPTPRTPQTPAVAAREQVADVAWVLLGWLCARSYICVALVEYDLTGTRSRADSDIRSGDN